MKATHVVLTGLALLAASLPGFAQSAGPVAPETTAASQLAASVVSYKTEDFEGSLAAAREALRLLEQTSALAYNNICAAQIRLEKYAEAVEACKAALERAPKFERARNNLEWAYESLAELKPTVGNYLNLAEVRYWQGAMDGSIAASKAALAIDPNSAAGYNNICAAHAARHNWEQAIAACEKALAIDPLYALASSNMAWARRGLAGEH